MSIARSLRSVPQVNYAAIHSGSGMFMPERDSDNEAVASLNTEIIRTSVAPTATAQEDPLPGSFSVSAASQLDALFLEAKNLQQEVELAKLTRQQRDKEHEMLRASKVALSPSKDSQLDALTLEAQPLQKEIHQAQLVQQQRQKECEVLCLRQELSALQRDNSGANRHHQRRRRLPLHLWFLTTLEKRVTYPRKWTRSC